MSQSVLKKQTGTRQPAENMHAVEPALYVLGMALKLAIDGLEGIGRGWRKPQRARQPEPMDGERAL